MTNRGIAPLNPGTTVGQFRLFYGDTQYVDLDPVEPGYGDYTELSDDEISLFLTQSSDSVTRAIGYYYIRLSGEAAKQSKEVEDYDLRVNLTKRAEDLRKTAQSYFELANAEDIASGASDFFQSYPFATQDPENPELAARVIPVM